MKTTVICTILLTGLDTCGATVSSSYQLPMETVEECVEYGKDVAQEPFVIGFTCEVGRQ